MKFVIGLGNPGKRYELTRHNLGFLVVDVIAARQGIRVSQKVSEALTAEWAEEGERVILAKPQTFMNRSGPAVKELLREYHGTPNELVVIYDDLDLPFGRIRVRAQGSAGGHRGIGSIMESLEDASFPRVRLGIGRPPDGIEAADYVLERFDPDQSAALADFIGKASDAVFVLLREGAEAAMREFNRAN